MDGEPDPGPDLLYRRLAQIAFSIHCVSANAFGVKFAAAIYGP